MKTVEYWEQKRHEVLQAIELFDHRVALKCIPTPPRKGNLSHRAWRKEYELWRSRKSRARALAERREKLNRRLAYIEERVQATTPTFWSKL